MGSKTKTLLQLITFSIAVCNITSQTVDENQNLTTHKLAIETLSTPSPLTQPYQQSTHKSTRSVTSIPQDSATRTTAGRSNMYTPVFKQESYYTEMEETTQVRTSILSVRAFDLDLSKTISYRIDGNQQILDTFAIDEQSGDITLLQTLANSNTSVYNFEVVASDDTVDPFFARAKVEIVVTGENTQAPVFEESYYNTKVSESSPVRTDVIRIVARDDDRGQNGEISYSFEHESFAWAPFSIGRTTGIISVSGTLSWHKQKKYVLVIQASDQGSPPLSSTVRVYITIMKSVPNLGNVDFYGAAVLVLTEGPTTLAPTTEPWTTIVPNSNYPMFDEDDYEWTIAENTPVGTLIARVSAIDWDEGEFGELKYSLNPGNIAEFTIDGDTGSIKVAESLLGVRGSIFFNIIATDKHPEPKSSIARIEVIVVEVNVNAPVFEKELYEARVKENALRYGRVMRITANDEDTGRNGKISYTFQSGKNGGGTFAIDRSDGIIRLLKLLDRELISEYDLIVEATDNGIPPLQTRVPVHVTVTDVNDNAPKFPSYYIRMYIMENSPEFQIVGTLHATDADKGKNAEIRYAMLLDSEDAYKFQLDFRTGDLHALTRLDREEQKEYRLTVRAASPPLVSQANVVVYVLDENDNPPVPYNSNVYLNFYGDMVPTSKVGHLGASDPDSTSEVTFELQESEYSDLFSVDQSTGEFYVRSELEGVAYRMPKIVAFNFNVSDGLFNSTGTVTVHLGRILYETLQNSLSLMLLKKMTSEKFIKSKHLDAFIELVAKILETDTEDVSVIGLFDVVHPFLPPAINVTIAARQQNGEYYTSAQLRARISLEQERMWELVAVMPPVDKLCNYEICGEWKNCKGMAGYKRTVPTLISPTYSFVSVEWEREYHCTCPPGMVGRNCNRYRDFCRNDPCQRYGKCKAMEDRALCDCQDGFIGEYCELDMRYARCPPDICQNNGTCVESYYGGFYCECPVHFEGLGQFCEGTIRTFTKEGAYIAFEELGWHSQLNIKLSFRTYRTNGLLLYNTRSNRQHADYIALEIVNSQLVFSFSLGELFTRVHAGRVGGVSDGEWHDVQINYARQHVLLGLDRCIHWVETIKPDEFLQWNVGNRTCLGYGRQVGGRRNLNVTLTPEELCDIDLANLTCLGHGSQYGYYGRRFFDLDGPLFLGAAHNYWFGLATLNKDFVGCIREVFIDYKRLDLNKFLKENSTTIGCDLRFNDPCQDHDRCNQADEALTMGPIRIVRTRYWEKAIQIIWKPPENPPVNLDGYQVRYTEVHDDIPYNWHSATVPQGKSNKKKRRLKFRKLQQNTMYLIEIRPYGGNVYGDVVRLNITTGVSEPQKPTGPQITSKPQMSKTTEAQPPGPENLKPQTANSHSVRPKPFKLEASKQQAIRTQVPQTQRTLTSKLLPTRPHTELPHTTRPQTEINLPQTARPQTEIPQTTRPHAEIPQTERPQTTRRQITKRETLNTQVFQTTKLQTQNPQTSKPQTQKTQTSKPQTQKPQSEIPETSKPHSEISQTQKPQSERLQTSGQETTTRAPTTISATSAPPTIRLQ